MKLVEIDMELKHMADGTTNEIGGIRVTKQRVNNGRDRGAFEYHCHGADKPTNRYWASRFIQKNQRED